MLSILFFKQKTAYEMRISDWSSDVCSSDLLPAEMTTVEPRAFAPAIASASAWLQAPEPPRLRLMTWATLVLSGTPGTWPRSEERTVGKACISKCRSRWSQYLSKKNKQNTKYLLLPHQ